MHLSFPARPAPVSRNSFVSVLLSALSPSTLFPRHPLSSAERRLTYTCSLFSPLHAARGRGWKSKSAAMLPRGAAFFHFAFKHRGAPQDILFLASFYLAECFLARISPLPARHCMQKVHPIVTGHSIVQIHQQK
jgi:hypothetical protein